MRLPSVSIITFCKGRLHHLRETIYSMLAQDYAGEWEIVVVDYACPDDAIGFVRSLNSDRVRCVRVNDAPWQWSMTHARNVGAKFANGQTLALIDADNHPEPRYLTTGVNAMLDSGESLCIPGANGQYAGACFVTADLYHAVRGNDENLVEYGLNDSDFYQRCLSQGRPSFRLNPRCVIGTSMLRMIYHDDNSRTHFSGVKSMTEAVAINRIIARDSSRAVNPNGYGITRDYTTHGAIYSPEIRDLRSRNRWPESRADIPFNNHGWLGEGNRRGLSALLQEVNPHCILEVGSWLGLSARHMLDHSSAHLVCVDAWDHAIAGQRMLGEAGLSDERTLYDQFFANNWHYRDRITMVRAATIAGMWICRDAGLQPDVIYIDAAHDLASFESDLSTAHQCFPGAILCGDDWGWGGPDNYTIRPAVMALAETLRMRVDTDGEWWSIR